MLLDSQSASWLAGQLQLAGWLGGHLTNVTCIWMQKMVTPPQDLIRVRLTFFQMAGWLANCSWLADWLSNKIST